ncbi:MAG: MucR family transcriptional regulator [Proteobacteria bacterium]|nr:MucR family transcriptional regulator [Pseudomonadota bacterium]
MTEQQTRIELLELTADIVAAHASNNTVAPGDLTAMIRDVYQALAALDAHGVAPEPPTPAVPVKKSIFPDYIVCLEDGKKLKMLKRHLRTSYGLSPEQYRERWGLAPGYPMVAPNYAKQRSSLAKKIGLGRKPGTGRGAGKRRK